MWIGDPDLDDLSTLKKARVFGEIANLELYKDKDVFDWYINKGTQVDKCITKYANLPCWMGSLLLHQLQDGSRLS